jgi:hypothetical protein
MQVSYGPPGHKGVTQIMGLGAASDIATIKAGVAAHVAPHKVVAGLSVLTYVVGAVVGSSMAKNMAIGGLGATLLAHALQSGAVKAPALPLPTSVQGWG